MKYAKGLLIVLLIISVIINIYFYRESSNVKKYLAIQYEINTNQFYSHMYKMEEVLDRLLKEQTKSEPDMVKVGRDIAEIKAEVWQAHEQLTDMKGYDYTESEISYIRITEYLYSMYFDYRVNHLETKFYEEDLEELFQVAKEMKGEFRTVRSTLPIFDTYYMELSEEERKSTWIDIVDQLPESETLDAFKRFISFNRISGN